MIFMLMIRVIANNIFLTDQNVTALRSLLKLSERGWTTSSLLAIVFQASLSNQVRKNRHGHKARLGLKSASDNLVTSCRNNTAARNPDLACILRVSIGSPIGIMNINPDCQPLVPEGGACAISNSDKPAELMFCNMLFDSTAVQHLRYAVPTDG